MTRNALNDAVLEYILTTTRDSQPVSTALRDALWRKLLDAGLSPAPADRQEPPLHTATDEALLRQLLAGNAAAFDLLVERHLGALVGYARRSLSTPEAEDAAQEAFLVLYRKAKSLRPGATIRGFLFGVLRNEILKILTGKARKEIPTETVPDTAAETATRTETKTESPLDKLVSKERQDRLAQALEKACNPLEQQVILLALDGRAGPDIARALGLTAKHARVIKCRATRKLREQLAEDTP